MAEGPPAGRGACRPGAAGGFTLIELLAVVVLAGLVAGLGAGALVHLAEPDPFTAARERLVAGFVLATSAARRGEARTVELDATGLRHELEPLATLPDTVSVVWSDPDGGAVARLRFDSRGRSRDLIITCRAGEERRRYLRSGITGLWLAAEPRP
ncbi:MAG: pilus assembly FimT family protein [Planctomycetota bacterium]